MISGSKGHRDRCPLDTQLWGLEFNLQLTRLREAGGCTHWFPYREFPAFEPTHLSAVDRSEGNPRITRPSTRTPTPGEQNCREDGCWGLPELMQQPPPHSHSQGLCPRAGASDTQVMSGKEQRSKTTNLGFVPHISISPPCSFFVSFSFLDCKYF